MKLIYTFLYTLFCIFLFWILIYYVTSQFIIIETMDTIYSTFDIDLNTPKTNHTVNLPINTNYSCENKCGPKAQCSITREQCTSDIDCYGCQLTTQFIDKLNNKKIKPYNDAGKLIYNQNPQYSELTTDIGTHALYLRNINKNVPKPYLGIDKWMNSANIGMQYYYKSYNYPFIKNPNILNYIPDYKVKESATGLFLDYGPIAANG